MALKYFCLALFISFVIFDSTQGQNKYAAKVRECYLKDKTKFDSCLLKFWKEITPLLKSPVPELKLPQLDPLSIPSIHFNEQSNLVNANAKITDITVNGASNLIPTMVKVDPKDRLVTIHIKFPYLNCTGTYTIKGTVMLMPIEGTGPFSLNMTEIEATAKLHIVQKGTGVQTSKLEIDFKLKDLFLDVEGIMGGDTVGDAIKNMIRENSLDILQDIKPAIIKKLEQSILEVSANAFEDMPVEAFIEFN
ncbi:hypothetical protein CHUAL_009854 [Chamberlinius hualienensis]